MFGLSGEHLLILAGILLIFGPRKLPELGSSVGKALKNFKEGLNSPSSSGKIEARPANAEVHVAGSEVRSTGTLSSNEPPASTEPRV